MYDNEQNLTHEGRMLGKIITRKWLFESPEHNKI